MKIQGFFLVFFLIMHAAWVCCSSVEDAIKKSNRHVHFHEDVKIYDGGPCPQALDYVEAVIVDDDCDEEEVPETHGDSEDRVKCLGVIVDDDCDEKEVPETHGDSEDDTSTLQHPEQQNYPFSVAPQNSEAIANQKITCLHVKITEINRSRTFREYYAERKAKERRIELDNERQRQALNRAERLLGCCGIDGEGIEKKI